LTLEEEIIRQRRLIMEDAWRMELELRKIPDIRINSTNLRKKSWTIHCEGGTELRTLKKVYGLLKLRLIKDQKPITKTTQKTRGLRRKRIYELTNSGRVILIAKNACFGRKDPIHKQDEMTQQGCAKYIGKCSEDKLI